MTKRTGRSMGRGKRGRGLWGGVEVRGFGGGGKGVGRLEGGTENGVRKRRKKN